jgi:hypothetical protein
VTVQSGLLDISQYVTESVSPPLTLPRGMLLHLSVRRFLVRKVLSNLPGLEQTLFSQQMAGSSIAGLGGSVVCCYALRCDFLRSREECACRCAWKAGMLAINGV